MPDPAPGRPDLAEELTPGEQRVETVRRRVGFVLGPLVFLVLLWWPFSQPDSKTQDPLPRATQQQPTSQSAPGLKPEARRLAAVLALVIVLWVSEALPMAITALLGA